MMPKQNVRISAKDSTFTPSDILALPVDEMNDTFSRLLNELHHSYCKQRIADISLFLSHVSRQIPYYTKVSALQLAARYSDKNLLNILFQEQDPAYKIEVMDIGRAIENEVRAGNLNIIKFLLSKVKSDPHHELRSSLQNGMLYVNGNIPIAKALIQRAVDPTTLHNMLVVSDNAQIIALINQRKSQLSNPVENRPILTNYKRIRESEFTELLQEADDFRKRKAPSCRR